MQVQFHQTNQYNHFNRCLVGSGYKTNAASSLHARRRMIDAQYEVKETESVRVSISGEAMALARQAKAMERLEQYVNANVDQTREMKASEAGAPSNESVQLTDEEIYDELLNQVNIWGDKSYALRHNYNH
ncbi:MAG: hypothetical protein K2K74_19470 [Lachnospiraceae bacterium]|nr:hypothetical protein [Lachnospiraceae bacterium]